MIADPYIPEIPSFCDLTDMALDTVLIPGPHGEMMKLGDATLADLQREHDRLIALGRQLMRDIDTWGEA